MVNRKTVVDEIIRELDDQTRRQQQDRFFYHIVYGPSGGGKSFVVYQLAATLMKDKRNFVVYINKATHTVIYDVVEIIKTKLKSLNIEFLKVKSFYLDESSLEFIEKARIQLAGFFYLY